MESPKYSKPTYNVGTASKNATCIIFSQNTWSCQKMSGLQSNNIAIPYHKHTCCYILPTVTSPSPGTMEFRADLSGKLLIPWVGSFGASAAPMGLYIRTYTRMIQDDTSGGQLELTVRIYSHPACQFWIQYPFSSWWFQHIQKIVVKMDHFPK